MLNKVLRWILVLPAALVGGIASTFPLHWIIMMSCSSEESVVKLDQESKNSLEKLLTGAVITFCFIYCGAKTAPSNNLSVATGLAGIMVAFHIGARIMMPLYFPKENPWAWLPLTLALGAIITAVTIVAQQEKEEQEEQKEANV